eukprot:TRINITY_DN7237_c0_g1_i2.p1 TRINITY_DN7237_c0_g1~~TRINITY_DN7237_c0_g1_i2.p1  ORF type:complete len:117 (-),score=18.29 TRINITY_DN7237_c0_g1_i2:27-353(-)
MSRSSSASLLDPFNYNQTSSLSSTNLKLFARFKRTKTIHRIIPKPEPPHPTVPRNIRIIPGPPDLALGVPTEVIEETNRKEKLHPIVTDDTIHYTLKYPPTDLSLIHI